MPGSCWFFGCARLARSWSTHRYRIRAAHVLPLFPSAAGMGISTVTAARILKGQLQHMQGEETMLEMDKFPYVALSKVSPCADSPEAACPAVLGVGGDVGASCASWRGETGNLQASGLLWISWEGLRGGLLANVCVGVSRCSSAPAGHCAQEVLAQGLPCTHWVSFLAVESGCLSPAPTSLPAAWHQGHLISGAVCYP